MKRFALATVLLTLMGLNIGCGGADDATPAPDSPAPPVEPSEGGDMDTPAEPEAPAE